MECSAKWWWCRESRRSVSRNWTYCCLLQRSNSAQQGNYSANGWTRNKQWEYKNEKWWMLQRSCPKPVSPLLPRCVFRLLLKQTNRCVYNVVGGKKQTTRQNTNISVERRKGTAPFFLYHLFCVRSTVITLSFPFRINLESIRVDVRGYSLVPEVPCKVFSFFLPCTFRIPWKKKCLYPYVEKQNNKSCRSPPVFKPELGYFFTHNFKIQAAFVFILSFLFIREYHFNEYALDDGLLIKRKYLGSAGSAGIGKIFSHGELDYFYQAHGGPNNSPVEDIVLYPSLLLPLSRVSSATIRMRHFFNALYYAITIMLVLYFLRKFVFPKIRISLFWRHYFCCSSIAFRSCGEY